MMYRVVTNGNKFRAMNEQGQFAVTPRNVQDDWLVPREWDSFTEAAQWCSGNTWRPPMIKGIEVEKEEIPQAELPLGQVGPQEESPQ